MKKELFFLLTLGLLICISGNSLWAQPPDKFVRTKIDQVLKVIHDTGWKNGNRADTLEERIVSILDDVFTFRQMTFRALGPYARQISDSQVAEVVPLFTRLLQTVYIDRLTKSLADSTKKYRIEKITVDRAETRARGRFAKVYTTTHLNRGGKISKASLNYKLIKLQGNWRVYDVEIEDVSLVQNYRQQFMNILANNPFEHLIKVLRERLETK